MAQIAQCLNTLNNSKPGHHRAKTLKKMQVRLTLKKPYTWPSRDPEKPNANNCGFVNTIDTLVVGQIVTFESLHPYSLGGDLNENHYKYFEGRTYRVSRHQNGFLNLIEQ